MKIIAVDMAAFQKQGISYYNMQSSLMGANYI